MTAKYLRIMFAKYLNLATGENRDKTVPDPMIRFQKALDAGKYSHLSKEDYEEMYQSVADESQLFYGETDAFPSEILKRAFDAIDLPYKTCLLLAGIIAKAVEKQELKFAKINDDFSPFMDLPGSDDDTELPFLTDDFDKRALNMSPQAIYSHLSKDVFGQDGAKRALSMFIFNHLHGRPSNLLLSGPTGSGKTALIDSLSKIPGLQITVLDGTSLVSTGYKGTHLQSAFSPDDNGKKICIIDEFDKVCLPHVNGSPSSGATNYRDLILTSFLQYLGHTKIHVENGDRFGSQTIDCTKTSFLLVGSFAHILQEMNAVTKRGIGFGAEAEHVHTHENTELNAEMLIKHGVHRELVGRINDIVSLKPLTADDFRRILDSPDASPICKLAKEYGVEVSVSETYKTLLAQEAYVSGLGCRAVYSALKRRLDMMLFNDCRQKKFYLDVPDADVPALPADPAKSDIARMPQPALAFAYAEEEHS